MKTKAILTSRTVWANAVGLVAIVLQEALGYELLPAEAQVGILALLNIVLRVITKVPLNWSLGDSGKAPEETTPPTPPEPSPMTLASMAAKPAAVQTKSTQVYLALNRRRWFRGWTDRVVLSISKTE